MGKESVEEYTGGLTDNHGIGADIENAKKPPTCEPAQVDEVPVDLLPGITQGFAADLGTYRLISLRIYGPIIISIRMGWLYSKPKLWWWLLTVRGRSAQ